MKVEARVAVLTVIIVTFASVAQGVKILGVFPLPSSSHYILGSSLMRGLAEKGHDVTVINPFGEKEKPKNGSYRDILLTGFLDIKTQINMFDFGGTNPIIFALAMNGMGNRMTELVLNHTNVLKLLQSAEKFDAVIVEQFVNDAHKAFAYHFKAPLVLFSTIGSNPWVNPLVSNPAPPSYVPELMINFSPHNFWHRVKNTLLNVFGELNRHLLFFPAQNKIMKRYFPDAPDLSVLNYNASLVLLNSHLSTNDAVPRVPSMVDIGGFHIKPPKKLPKDLQDFLDGAKEGVVYFSMGSALQSVNLPKEKRDAILKVFSKLKMKVLWKWEDDTLPGQPANVKLCKWLPQQDILAHPNVKLFVTHGGLLSLFESVYHGVPIVALPVFGDQRINAATAEWNGYGLSIVYSEMTEEKLSSAISDVLTNPKYRLNMQKRRKIMHDRRHPPIDDADYWIRYVIRHQGAPHLRVAGLTLSWHQYLSLDVALFVIASICAILYGFAFLSRKVVQKMTKRNGEQKLKKN